MAQKYFYTILLMVFICSYSVTAQENKQLPKTQDSATIEGLNLYPNPASNGRVSIATKNDLNKEIVIFDLLGKRILQTQLSGRELNISSLSPGVYIIKINEDNATATRKLIVR
ncbi:T9SS type A sorting domain-containing protein [Flavobacterium algicola]|uniref:T9SS type A sorting domain-containing protein n=1 Tax=Flavobacterium algicola TaxID=556529 RepID=UPI001EFE4F05|nr:T9SS type A sorting domain-containing protein [Flavobacterium algicola]MCG9792203.1 T9SS type A sorting domain-containing protein [Flavobacterium algicola]